MTEAVQVSAQVQGKPMPADPATDTDADRGDLTALNPDTGFAALPFRVHSPSGQGQNQDFFQVAQEAVKIFTSLVQVNQRISHDLTRTMVGGIAAPGNRNDLDL